MKFFSSNNGLTLYLLQFGDLEFDKKTKNILLAAVILTPAVYVQCLRVS